MRVLRRSFDGTFTINQNIPIKMKHAEGEIPQGLHRKLPKVELSFYYFAWIFFFAKSFHSLIAVSHNEGLLTCEKFTIWF